MATEEGIRNPERHEMQGRLFAQSSLIDSTMLVRVDCLSDDGVFFVEGTARGHSMAAIRRDSLPLISMLGRGWFDRGRPPTRRLQELSQYGGMGFIFTAVVNEDGEVVEVIKES